MSKHHDWVMTQKRQGKEVKHINGHNYLYEVSSH